MSQNTRARITDSNGKSKQWREITPAANYLNKPFLILCIYILGAYKFFECILETAV